MKNHVLHAKHEFPNFREFVEQIGDLYYGKVAYSYKRKATDKEIQCVNYEQLRQDVRALGAAMIDAGMQGKHIALVGKLSYRWILVYYATQAIGSVLVPLDRDWTAEDLMDTAVRAEIGVVFADDDVAAKSDAVRDRLGLSAVYSVDGEGDSAVGTLIDAGAKLLEAGDRRYFETDLDTQKLSLLVFTSGTTGKGKGVMLSQKALLSDMADVLPYIDFTGRTVGVLPPHHTYGSSVNILGHNSIGCEVYISGGLKYITRELKDIRPGHLVLVPLYLETFYRRILATLKEQGKEKLVFRMMKVSNVLRKAGIDLRRVFFKQILEVFGGEIRMIVTGGAHINQDVLDFYQGIGITVLNGYGITECAPIIAVNRSRSVIPGSVGYPLSIMDVKIDSPNENGEGEICVRGSNVMLGYYKDEAATDDAFDEEDYFKTGDYGKLEGGVLYITGRKKNLIILSNGKNVYPEEIETEFISVPGLVDVIVYEGQSKRGMMHNAIVAEIYPDYELLSKRGVSDVEGYFKGFVNEYNKTAVPYKKIGIVKIRTEEFPKNTLRKIMRFKLDMSID